MALGMAAAPIVSLVVVPWAAGPPRPGDRAEGGRPGRRPADEPPAQGEFTLANGAGFAVAVLADHGRRADVPERRPAAVKATTDGDGAALAGFAFNVLLIARAPLQLFQAIQTSILPHLRDEGPRRPARTTSSAAAINLTLLAIAGFAAGVALAMLALGPWLMDLFFGSGLRLRPRRPRARVARHGAVPGGGDAQPGGAGPGQAPQAAACWVAAAAFVVSLVAWTGTTASCRSRSPS